MAEKCYECNAIYDGWSCPVCDAKKKYKEDLEEQRRETERELRKQKEEFEKERMAEAEDRRREENIRWREEAEKDREREEDRKHERWLDREIDREKQESLMDEIFEEKERIKGETIEEQERIKRKAAEEQERIKRKVAEEQEGIKREATEEQKRIVANALKYESESKRNEAIRLIEGSMPEFAIKLLSDAISTDPSNMLNHLWLCVAYSKVGDLDKAVMYCRSWINLLAIDVNEVENPRNYIHMQEIISKLNNPPELMGLFLNTLNNSSLSLNTSYTRELLELYHWSVASGHLTLAKNIAKSACRALESNYIGLSACIDMTNPNIISPYSKDNIIKAMKQGGLLDTIIDVMRDIVAKKIDSVNKFCLMVKSLEACDLIKKPFPEDIFEKGFDGMEFNEVFRSMNSITESTNYNKKNLKTLQVKFIQAFEDQFEKYISRLNVGERISVVADYFDLCKDIEHPFVYKVFNLGFEEISKDNRNTSFSAIGELEKNGRCSQATVALWKEKVANIKEENPNISVNYGTRVITGSVAKIKEGKSIFSDNRAPRVINSKDACIYKIDKDNIFYDPSSKHPVMRLQNDGKIYPVKQNEQADISGEAVWYVDDRGIILDLKNHNIIYYLKDLKEENYTCNNLWKWADKQKINRGEMPEPQSFRVRWFHILLAIFIGLIIIGGLLPSKKKPIKNSRPSTNESSIPNTTASVGRLQIEAERGDSLAQTRLGYMYARGEEVKQDYSEALKWFWKAAKQGHNGAQSAIGILYENGKGVPKDYSEAIKWYRMAAEQGEPTAQHNLGRMYAMGHGVRKDYIQSYMWFDLASSGFPASEGEKKDKTVKMRNLVASKMTQVQVAKAEQLVREWKPNQER